MERHRLDPDVLVQEIHRLRTEGMPEDQRRALRAGRLIGLEGNPGFVAVAGALLTKLIHEATRGYTVEIRLGTPPQAGLAPPGPDELETLAGTLSQRAVTAVIAGDRAVLVGGEAHAYLKDRDVEVAQASTVDDPIVDVFFTGFSMSCQVLPAGEERCSVEVRLEYQELIELASIATGSKEVPETELPRIASVHANVPVNAALGSWTLVHSAPIEGTDRQLIVMLRVNRA